MEDLDEILSLAALTEGDAKEVTPEERAKAEEIIDKGSEKGDPAKREKLKSSLSPGTVKLLLTEKNYKLKRVKPEDSGTDQE